jgi:Secretion system C-terminal sorting domain/Reeler domain
MLKKLTLALSLLTLTILISDSFYNQVLSDSNGKAGYAKDPFGGNQTCARSGCHSTYANFAAPAGTIVMKDVSNTVVNSYTPGQTYTITINAMNKGTVSGFDAIVENATGTKYGTFTAGSGSQIKSGYMTHTFAGNSGINKSWTFQWVAPVAGSGSLNVYAVVNRANGNGSASGDSIFNTTLAISENTNAIVANTTELTPMVVYPNPAVNASFISIANVGMTDVLVNCFNLNGQLITSQTINNANNTINVSDWNKGCYLISLTAKNKAVSYQKLIIN